MPKRALVIGGTEGFGLACSKRLAEEGYRVMTVSRSRRPKTPWTHFTCDVGRESALRAVLDEVSDRSGSLQLLLCNVGYADPKPASELCLRDWDRAFRLNTSYVALTLEKLSPALGKAHQARVITIGSRWSLRTGCDYLVPYIMAKHALRALTLHYAQIRPEFSINHYCVPTMDTPNGRVVSALLRRLDPAALREAMDPEAVADRLVTHALDTRETGQTFLVNTELVSRCLM